MTTTSPPSRIEVPIDLAASMRMLAQQTATLTARIATLNPHATAIVGEIQRAEADRAAVQAAAQAIARGIGGRDGMQLIEDEGKHYLVEIQQP